MKYVYKYLAIVLEIVFILLGICMVFAFIQLGYAFMLGKSIKTIVLILASLIMFASAAMLDEKLIDKYVDRYRSMT